MSTAPKRPCAYPRCPETVEGKERYCPAHKKLTSKNFERTRETAVQRGYTKRWGKARKMYLNRHPLCVVCAEKGIYRAAIVVDHIVPHHNNQTLFWDESNWRPLCKRCHDRATALYDGGFGNPIKPKPKTI